MALKSYKCGNCGANLKVDTFNMSAVCEFCGQTLTFDTDEISDILEEREKTKREEARLKHEAELKKIETDADEFMEGAARVKQGFETVNRGLSLVKTIVICVVIGVILIIALIALIAILRHLG